MKKLITILFILAYINLYSQKCPVEGNAKTEKDKQSNILKNRKLKREKINTNITLLSILVPGNDTGRFKNTDYVALEGYIVDMKMGGPESCNCNSENKVDYDIHIYFGATLDAENENCMILEATPLFKEDISQYKGKKVRVETYLFFDAEHKGNAKNTCGSCRNIWRFTCWEGHPITKITLIN